MRLSTSTNIYFNRPDGTKATFSESVRQCSQAGYKVMDLNLHDANTFLPEFREDALWQRWLSTILDTASDVGIEFGQAHLPFYNHCHPDAVKDPDRQDEMARRAIDCAAAANVPWAVTHVGTAYGVQRPWRESLTRNRAYFEPLLDYAGERGVGIAFENLWDLNIAPLVRFGTTAEDIMEFIETLTHPNVGVCWDFEHAGLMLQDQTAGLSLVGNRLKATHLSDYFNTHADHLLPFHGRLDWHEAMAALKAVGYNLDLTFEIHNYASAIPDELIPAALAMSVTVGEHLIDLATH